MKMDNGQLVPDLRFPEFVGDWNEVSIDDSTKTVTSGSRDWAKFYSNSGAKFIRMTNLNRDGISLLLDELRYVSLPQKGADGKRTSLQSGDILISITAELGKIGLIPNDLGEAYINQHTALVRPEKDFLIPDFLAYKLSTNKTNIKLNRLNDSGAKAGLNLSTIRKFKFFKPTKNEQQKIANFLTAIDQRITKLKEKKAALEDYKKGLMQKIFSQEVRFVDDEGNNFPDWEDKRLGNIFEIQGGGTPSTTAETYWGSEINWFTPTEIKSKYSRESNRKITTLGLKKSSAKLLPKGTLLLTTRATIADMSICTEECTTNQGFQSFLPNDSHDLEYLYYWISNNKKVFIRKSSGSTFLEISKKEIKKIKIKIPILKEQQKIANFLSAIDQKIDAMDKQINDSVLFKKSLLQRMFV